MGWVDLLSVLSSVATLVTFGAFVWNRYGFGAQIQFAIGGSEEKDGFDAVLTDRIGFGVGISTKLEFPIYLEHVVVIYNPFQVNVRASGGNNWVDASSLGISPASFLVAKKVLSDAYVTTRNVRGILLTIDWDAPLPAGDLVTSKPDMSHTDLYIHVRGKRIEGDLPFLANMFPAPVENRLFKVRVIKRRSD